MATKYLGNVDFNGENLKIIDTEGRGLIQNNTNEIASVKAKANLNEKKINALTPRVDTLENTVDDLGDRLTVAESDVNNLEVHMAAAEDDIDTLEDSVGALTNRMTSAEGNIEALNDRMNTAETDIDNLTTDINNLTDAVNDHAEKIDGLTSDVEDLKPRMNAVEEKNIEQDEKLADLDERIVASTYEAGIGIYFGQGVEHTNINVEDELLDEIHESTRKNIEQDERLDYIEGNYVEAVEVNDSTHDIEIKRADGTVENIISGTVTTTPTGDVSKPTFTGDSMTSTGNFTPAGTVTSTASGTKVTLDTKTIKVIDSVGTLPSKAADTFVAPSFIYDSDTETLTLNTGSFTEGAFSKGTLPTTKDTVVAYGITHVTDPTVTSTFTGTQSTISVSGTPTGDVSKPIFTGDTTTEDVVFAD